MLNVGKLLFLSALAIGLGIFLGTVPLGDGRTAAEHSEAWFDGSAAPREKIHRAKRIESRPAVLPAGNRRAPVAVAAKPDALEQAAVPMTAGAANSPEQTSASDKAALDRIISGRASGR